MNMSLCLASLALIAATAPTDDDPLLRPIAPESAARWLTPQAPLRIFGNSYLVGFRTLNVGLIRTGAGLILIDAGVPQGVRAVAANIRRLGFDPRDVKLILSTEPHFDHAGGLAALARDTGATVVARAPAAAVLRTGRADPADPQAAWLVDFPAVTKLRVVRDGERIRLGDVEVTAVGTPGHTAGSTSWAWRSCEGRHCETMLFAASLNPVAADGYRFSDPAHRDVVAAFRRSFAQMRAWPCRIVLTAHPDQSGGDKKAAQLQARRSPNAFIDPGACRAYADQAARSLDEKIRSGR